MSVWWSWRQLFILVHWKKLFFSFVPSQSPTALSVLLHKAYKGLYGCWCWAWNKARKRVWGLGVWWSNTRVGCQWWWWWFVCREVDTPPPYLKESMTSPFSNSPDKLLFSLLNSMINIAILQVILWYFILSGYNIYFKCCRVSTFFSVFVQLAAKNACNCYDKLHYSTLWCLHPSTDSQLLNQHFRTCCHCDLIH